MNQGERSRGVKSGGSSSGLSRDASGEPFSNSSIAAAPSISLPKGGGAIKGIGEKFDANPVTGTGSMSVPIAVSPGRSGFRPQLSLSYDSGAGNGLFGLGWNLSLPEITRKTNMGLPKYANALPRYEDVDESDVFIFSDAEDLVPVLDDKGKRVADTTTAAGYTIHRYRPRIEGLFARIERWSSTSDPTECFWRSISKDNITTWFGKDAGSRITDPDHPTHIFSWLISSTYDDKGNAIIYEYVPENSDGVDIGSANERNRTPAGRAVNRHIKRIKYGNKTSRLAEPELTKLDWHFEVVFDYGENHYLDYSPVGADPFYIEAWNEPPQPMPWPCRPDAFSSYRAGFEVRTYRLCRRVLMFHDFSELGDTPCLVGSTEFTYDENPISTYLQAVTHSGFIRQRDKKQNWLDRYHRKSLPPLEFAYSQAPTSAAMARLPVAELDADSLTNLPVGLSGSQYHWVDLDGESISGVLSEQVGAWYYKENQGEGNFGSARLISEIPSLATQSSKHQLIDLDGNGQLDVTLLEAPTPGFYARTQEVGWERFHSFRQLPNIAWNDPNLKFLDLSGDGRADVIISEDNAFLWYASRAKEGFAEAERVMKTFDEEHGPHLLFADGTETIFLADMSGDGLTDILRARNGEVCYWPNLGYGRFGTKIAMENAPWFDTSDLFNPRLIRLSDIDGNGVSDIIYLGRDATRIYYNQSGNGWSDAVPIPELPRVDDLDDVRVVDLLGRGTACLVWSSPLPGNVRNPMRYIDLMAGQKPHLLIKAVNNLGAETQVSYVTSTHFYLADKLAGKPWITRLPFPVHVVERVETFDRISNNRFVTRYAYHHGFFDSVEREFRGFGMVEQWDTEEFTAFSKDDSFMSAANVNSASHVPPAYMKTWYHTGVYLGRNRVSNYFAGLLNDQDVGEYFIPHRTGDATGDAAARTLLLDDTVLPSGLTLDEEREACRALKGSMLRQEIYALDGLAKEGIPYAVTEQNFTISRLQKQGGNRHAVFFTHSREALSYHYERNADDPRVSHAMTIEVDSYGNVLKSLAIGYGRTPSKSSLTLDWDKARQEQLFITYTENDVTNAIDDVLKWPDDLRTPLPAEARTFEVTGLQTAPGLRFSFDDFTGVNILRCANLEEIQYEQTADATKQQKRLIECRRTLYRKDDLSGPLPLRIIQPLAILYERYKQAFTPGLLAEVFNGRVTDAMLAEEARYVHSEGDANWWIPLGRVFFSLGSKDDAPTELAYAQKHFFLHCRYRDPFYTDQWNTESTIQFDSYDLFPNQIVDAKGNTFKAVYDYRVLQAQMVTDPNGNRSQAAFDVLGMVVATAVQGKVNEPDGIAKGDLLEGFDSDLPLSKLQAFVANPSANVVSLLGNASTRVVYDVDRYQRCGQPAFAATLAREIHYHEPGGANTKIQLSCGYSDGFGRMIQTKVQAESGLAPQRQAPTLQASGDTQPGALMLDAQGKPVFAHTTQRWVGTGRTVYNNKGKPVRQYEPFFSTTHLYEPERELTDTGVSPTLFYDPLERVVATLHPDHTYEKVVFDPWQQSHYDVNDTVAPRNQQTGDPRTDPDIKGYVAEYFKSQAKKWQTWYQQRESAVDKNEVDAAKKAGDHADTPSVAHADSLGRTFLTVAHNRVVCKKHPLDGSEDHYFSRIELDIEGNHRAVLDPITQAWDAQDKETVDELGRIVMRYDYDMLGHAIRHLSMESGGRWSLQDIAGKPIRAWDDRGHAFKFAYDVLHRPVAHYVIGTTNDSDPHTRTAEPLLIDKLEYGEDQANAEALNLRTRVYRQYDTAGITTSAAMNPQSKKLEAYDFKGNLLRGSHQLVRDYMAIPDWSQQQQPELEQESFTSSTRYDALNRPIQVIAPYSSLGHGKHNVIQPVFNEANLLQGIDVWLAYDSEPSALLDPNNKAPSAVGIDNIDYDAKAQRQRIDYKNGVSTHYKYDPLTYRLRHMLTQRKATAFPNDCPKPPPSGWPGCQVQNLFYTYDPVGDITHIRDDAQQAIYFRNAYVEPSNDYTYDALYRLIEGRGREHLGQASGVPVPSSYNDAPCVGLLQPGDGKAMATYIERYEYDAVGNFKQLQHRSNDQSKAGWTRTYQYKEVSLIEDGSKGTLRKISNRLSLTTIGTSNPISETYAYDAHGNMLHMLQLQAMQWDFQDQLQLSQRQAVNAQDADGNIHQGERTYYVYNASGERVRKVTALNGKRIKERLYIGSFEIYREYDIDGTSITLERETLHVMDDKQRIAVVETRTLDTKGGDKAPKQLIRYQISNHLGSASLELDEQAGIISYEEYTPYGSTSYQMVRNHTDTPKRYRYTGKERDEETGLTYHGARYFAAWLGRWTAADPAGLVDGLNLYRYSRNSPVVFKDPSGMQPPDPRQYATREEFLAAAPTPYSSKYLNQIWNQAHPPTHTRAHTTVHHKVPQYTLGPRGEKIPTAAWRGGPLSNISSYDKPIAYYEAEAGNYQAAELAEHYLCATCHVLSQVDPRKFSLRGYVEGYQRAYIQGFIEVPLKATPVGAAWDTGVSVGEAITGKGSGLHISNISTSIVYGKSDRGRVLTKGERAMEAGSALVSVFLFKLSASAKAGSASSVPPQTGWQSTVLSNANNEELELWDEVLKSPRVAVGRTASGSGHLYAALQTEGGNALNLDSWLQARGLQWTQRWQDIFNRALYDRAALLARPTQIMAGGPYTAGEAAAAESGAAASGIHNEPLWPLVKKAK